MGIFSKINFGLKKTRDKMSGAIDDLLDSFDALSDDLYTELEEILVMGDVGVTTAVEITQALKERAKKKRLDSPQLIKDEIKNIVAEMLEGGEDMGLITKPSIILVIGVNGVGKTTTIGKMAAMYKAQGKKVILAAADTFRAAAIDQLQVWADRAGVDIVKHKEGADPAAVIFDTIAAGRAREADIIICDTAGRLHNKKNLMDELGKIYKVIDKELPYSDREVLLVLDATTGQNAVNQAREFQSVAELTGIILTKLDGTARGGVVLSIKNELKIPVKFVGVGEKLDDLQPFDPKAFAEGLFESVNENEFPEDYALAEAESYEDDTIFEKAAEEDFEEAGVYDSSEVGEDEPFAAVEEESADLEAADTSGDEGYSQEEESVVEEEKQEDKKRKKGLFGMFSKK
ncbi:MAG: signal recognition particle-docking protein FtsY [Clostridiales bacterium]|nr:signal recognition particle-docking protein FtsY [Clostridiales bacterium]